MGQSCSVLNRRHLKNNLLLQELFGKETIPIEEPFWNQFLSFQCNAIITKSIFESIWDILDEKFGALILQNYRSGNIVNLLAVFIKYAKTLIAIYQSGDADQGNGDILIKQIRNALLVLRFIFQEMAMRNGCNGGLLLLEIECLPQDEKDSEGNEAISVFEEFISYLFKLLLCIPVSDVSLELHLEILLTCFVLLSCYLYNIDVVEDDSNAPSKKSAYLTALRLRAVDISNYLFTNIINRHETSKTVVHNTMSIIDEKPTSVMVASFDWLKSFFSNNDQKTEDSEDDFFPGSDMTRAKHYQTTKSDLSCALANHSLLLCILLSCSDFSYLDSSNGDNPFSNALASFSDSEIQIQLASSDKSSQENQDSEKVFNFRLPVSQIYVSLSSSLSEGVGLRRRPSLVLLYLLLHNNASFKACALSRSDVDRLVVPLLRILYGYTTFSKEETASDNSSVQQSETPMGRSITISSWQRDNAYLALICLLILTEDDSFCRFANDLKLSSKTLLSFYSEHGDISTLGNYPSLASVSLLVLLRAIRRNLLIGRDHYLHTSCLAALANLCAHSNDIHSAVASRLVDLLVALARRRSRLFAFINSGSNTNTSVEETEAALSATDDTARLLLEAINAALSARGKGPTANPHLVVSLLREQEAIISAFRNVPNFVDLLNNIQMIVEYFAASIERESTPPSPSKKQGNVKNYSVTLTSVGEVVNVVKTAGSHFSVSRLRKMPDLKFHYVEESSASSHFFLPYALALYQRYSFVHWANLPCDSNLPEITEPVVEDPNVV